MKSSQLYAAGVLLVVVGTVILAANGTSSSSTSFGGVVFVGPIPIVFGAGPNSGSLIVVSVVIAVAMVLVFAISVLLSRRSNAPGQ